jgi:hypothetical protein
LWRSCGNLDLQVNAGGKAREGDGSGTRIACGFEWEDENKAECVSCTWKGTAGDAYSESDESAA